MFVGKTVTETTLLYTFKIVRSLSLIMETCYLFVFINKRKLVPQIEFFLLKRDWIPVLTNNIFPNKTNNSVLILYQHNLNYGQNSILSASVPLRNMPGQNSILSVSVPLRNMPFSCSSDDVIVHFYILTCYCCTVVLLMLCYYCCCCCCCCCCYCHFNYCCYQ